MIRLLFITVLAVTHAVASNVVQSSIYFDGQLKDACLDVSACDSQSQVGSYLGSASAGVGHLSTGEPRIDLRAFSNFTLMDTNASAMLDETLVFPGNLVVATVNNVADVAQWNVTLDAPRYTGNLHFEGLPDFGEAWEVQPDVPVHVVISGNLHISDGAVNFSVGLISGLVDLGTPVPEPATLLLLGAIFAVIARLVLTASSAPE